MRFFFLFCAILPLASATSAAQPSLSSLDRGTRVRIDAPQISQTRFSGNVSELDGLLLTVTKQKTGEQLVVPFSTLVSVERSLGRSRGRGAIVGAVIGLVAGLGLGVVCVSVCDTGGSGGANLAPAGGLFLGPPVGAVLGALIGKERWQRLPLSAR